MVVATGRLIQLHDPKDSHVSVAAQMVSARSLARKQQEVASPPEACAILEDFFMLQSRREFLIGAGELIWVRWKRNYFCNWGWTGIW
jgi:hypothetical protein